MKRLKTIVLILAIAVTTGGTLLAQVAPADNIPNWSVPATWSPARASGGIQTMVDVSEAIPFVAIAPCRIADTRAGQGFSGQAGPPGLTSFMNRNFQITGSPATLPAPPAGCPANAIPAGADAVSIQFTVVFPSSGGNLVAWQAGATQPVTSVINWDAGTVALGSGTIIPLSVAGAITLRLNTAAAGQSAQVVLDVNGYFSDELPTQQFFDIHGNYQNGTLSHFLNQATTTVTQALWAETYSTTSGSSGLLGQAQGAAGYTFGVKGTTNSQSADSAGVKGVAGDGDPLGDTVDCTSCYSAGVRGASFTYLGVLGLSETLQPKGGGVVGIFLNTAETEVSVGILGYDVGVGVRSDSAITKAGTVTFTEPHPKDPSKIIQYASLEGPEAGTYFRGKGRFQNGLATIAVPEDFRIVTDAEGLSIQVTPIGQMASVAVMQIDLDRIVIRGSRNVEFFYTVNGVRKAERDFSPIAENRKDYVPGKRDLPMPAYKEEIRNRLISNGTYNADGTVNLETAKRLGWDRLWAERESPPEEPAPTAMPHHN